MSLRTPCTSILPQLLNKSIVIDVLLTIDDALSYDIILCTALPIDIGVDKRQTTFISKVPRRFIGVPVAEWNRNGLLIREMRVRVPPGVDKRLKRE